MQQTLFMLLGVPGSGKTTFSRQLAAKLGAVHFSSDHMRKKMFGEHVWEEGNVLLFDALNCAAHEVLKAGHSVIYDANHDLLEARNRVRNIAANLKLPAVLIWLRVPLDVAIERAAARREDDYTRLTEPHEVAVRYLKLQAPIPGEGCVILDGRQPFSQQYPLMQQQLREKSALMSSPEGIQLEC